MAGIVVLGGIGICLIYRRHLGEVADRAGAGDGGDDLQGLDLADSHVARHPGDRATAVGSATVVTDIAHAGRQVVGYHYVGSGVGACVDQRQREGDICANIRRSTVHRLAQTQICRLRHNQNAGLIVVGQAVALVVGSAVLRWRRVGIDNAGSSDFRSIGHRRSTVDRAGDGQRMRLPDRNTAKCP